MEPLSTAASLAALAEISRGVLKLCRRCRHASTDLKLAALRVESLVINLELLRAIERDMEEGGAPEQDYTRVMLLRTIETAKTALALIRALLPKVIIAPTRKGRMRWVLAEKTEYDELMTVLIGVESSIGTAMQLLHW
jgi:hypothetical protein